MNNPKPLADRKRRGLDEETQAQGATTVPWWSE
jgi:hypothetical protein